LPDPDAAKAIAFTTTNGEDVVMLDADQTESSAYNTNDPGRTPAEPADDRTTIERRSNRKPHRWSGTGAEKDIVREGLVHKLKNIGFESSTSALPSAQASRGAPSREQTATSGRAPPQHDKWVNGKYVAYQPAAVETGHPSRSLGTSAAAVVSTNLTPPADDPVHSTASTNVASSLATSRSRRECLCGLRAESGRGSIACDNARCARGNFHLACVELERRRPNWRCEECA
ncbi:hypothetical protein LTR53_012741, partial [Teratosphaeriaceae sp. CCFEE 6253]